MPRFLSYRCFFSRNEELYAIDAFGWFIVHSYLPGPSHVNKGQVTLYGRELIIISLLRLFSSTSITSHSSNALPFSLYGSSVIESYKMSADGQCIPNLEHDFLPHNK